MRLEIDEHGYLYLIMPSGEKRYLLVDVPGCTHYGKIWLGTDSEGALTITPAKEGE